MSHVLQKFTINYSLMHLFTVFLVYVILLMFLSDRKWDLIFLFNIISNSKSREPEMGLWFQNGTLRPYWNVLVNIVPDNQICKIIQHIDSVETELLKFSILIIWFKQIGKISAKLSNVIRKWSINFIYIMHY